MTGYRQILRYVFIVTAILLVIGFELTTARGRGGGGFRGGFRGSRGGSRGSSRSGSVAWKAAVVAGVYYGSTRYSRRSRYHNNQAPRICENNEGKDSNGTVYGRFICPLGEQPDDYDYCCGESGKQRCCRFADDPGRLAGLIVGLLLSFIFIGVMIFICCKCCNKKQKSSGTVIKPMSNNFSMKSSAPPSSAYPYDGGMYPGAYPAAGAPPYSGPAPPSYDQSSYAPNPTGGLPYTPNQSAPSYSFSDPNSKGYSGVTDKSGPPRY